MLEQPSLHSSSQIVNFFAYNQVAAATERDERGDNLQRFVMQVSPGIEGVEEFKSHVKELLGFEPDDEFDVSFSVPVPSFGCTPAAGALHGMGGNLNLTGLHQFDAVTTVAMANRLERQRLMHLPRLAHSLPGARPSQLSAAVALAEAEAQAAEAVAAAAAEEAASTAAAAAAVAAAALASSQAAPVSLRHQGPGMKRERDEAPPSCCAGTCSSKDEEALMPGLRVRTTRAQPFQQRPTHLQPGCQIPADAGNLHQASHASSSEAAGCPSKRPRTSSMLCI
ncbi:hypothetical protein DUNSADRAFT_3789 [Dunaliella salina]|uniref:Uncharacterized protein n=1 Tax=Dunaliella salina TaxID=3046 RepID=A0ABQ7GT87_DUNSA|nr:hypothetical protein DUNSADRAFT_3789 [Dunaliella salina]|eukprot:KAF5837826.1 hypothetical protein DUNSADRAFT_3789 [Dunaliella salina]